MFHTTRLKLINTNRDFKDFLHTSTEGRQKSRQSPDRPIRAVAVNTHMYKIYLVHKLPVQNTVNKSHCTRTMIIISLLFLTKYSMANQVDINHTYFTLLRARDLVNLWNFFSKPIKINSNGRTLNYLLKQSNSVTLYYKYFFHVTIRGHRETEITPSSDEQRGGS